MERPQADAADRIVLGLEQSPGTGWARPEPVTGVTVGAVSPAGSQGRAFLVRVTSDPEREGSVLRFDVEYAVGPFRFVTTAEGPLGTTVVFCGAERPVVSLDGCAER